jgi:hypothetical protein
MGSTRKAGIVGAVTGVTITLIGVWGYMAMKGSGTGDKPLSFRGPNKVERPVDKPTPMAQVKKKSIAPKAVERVRSRTIKGQFVTTGRGEDAKWGIGKEANFRYTVIVAAESKILSKKALPEGNIKVEEIRTFKKVVDSMVVSDVDFKLRLDTIPVETFSKAIDVVAAGWAFTTGDIASSSATIAGNHYVKSKLNKLDGKSLRLLLGWAGITPTAEVEKELNKLANDKVAEVFAGVMPISGKSYKITYYQDKNGQPMWVKFKYADGKDVLNDKEKMVLRRVNSFMDYNMVPDKKCRPGDSWKVNAEDIEEVFDPYVPGKYSGSIKVQRKANDSKGNWVIAMEQCVINTVSNSGTTTGSLRLKQGTAIVNPENICINDLTVSGQAKLKRLSRHHFLFTARISGECNFEGRIVSSDLKKK